MRDTISKILYVDRENVTIDLFMKILHIFFFLNDMLTKCEHD